MRDGPVHDGLFKRSFMRLALTLDRRRGWDRLPKPVAMLTLIGLRMVLRRENLFDPSGATVAWGPELPPPGPRPLVRSIDGTGTDLVHPEMGSARTHFGRNVPIAQTRPNDVLEPNPRLVSRALLRRGDTFKPATTLNLLAAAWIQFEVHDWMSHGDNDPKDNWEVELEEDDPWPYRPMQIQRTRVEPTTDGGPPVYRNTETHWWDASQVYGSNEVIAGMIRDEKSGNGHLLLDERGIIPFDPPTLFDPENKDKLPPALRDLPPDASVAGVTGNWWLGLAMLHSLFMQEHNAICDHLHAAYPAWDDQELYDHARLVNAALMAKIHTVEWTPALLADSVLETGMRINWWGLQGEALWKRFGRLTKSEELSGIPGSQLYHHGVPYAMTEEFLAVYRMHPLIPDTYSLRTHQADNLVQKLDFKDVSGKQTHLVLGDPRLTLGDLLYSFGTMYPGAISLHNFPNALCEFQEAGGPLIDLAAIDILRCRERGVPRYNEFRRRFHLEPAERFEDFSTDARTVEEIRRIYRDPEDVDLIVGLYAERAPEGFAFSDTAFRVFILMASRRLKSDRFFTYDYRPEVYTREGLDWIEDNTMKSVILRHYPGLAPAVEGIDNAFKPWRGARAG